MAQRIFPPLPTTQHLGTRRLLEPQKDGRLFFHQLGGIKLEVRKQAELERIKTCFFHRPEFTSMIQGREGGEWPEEEGCKWLQGWRRLGSDCESEFEFSRITELPPPRGAY